MQQYRNDAALTARSLVASLLLGMRQPALTGKRLVAAGRVFGFNDGAVRVALSRMTAAGELAAEGGSYRLAGPLLERHQRQEEGRRPRMRTWDGTWRMAVVGASGPRPPSQRAEVRQALAGLRLAEMREGVWTRPDNLGASTSVAGCVWWNGARPTDDAVAFAAALWDLPGWTATAHALLAAMGRPAGSLPEAFAVAAAVVRHLRDDPLLPAQLLADDWPGDHLRAAYDVYERDFQRALRPVLNG